MKNFDRYHSIIAAVSNKAPHNQPQRILRILSDTNESFPEWVFNAMPYAPERPSVHPSVTRVYCVKTLPYIVIVYWATLYVESHLYHAGGHQELRRWIRRQLTTAARLQNESLRAPVSRPPSTPSTAAVGRAYKVMS